ncbi:putative bifunctional diguanylate cyclase/phosphodiesterase [Martelella soudanensis]|uniref:putative bifunctional diguanylate cyclase/phosphodiesterase n=1 Tax=unclassified Martelella TaxID=2629616 RepID=UPI0015DDF38A|nr:MULTISPECIES: EAL domain-containing protein [unclassified Martelella]
MHWLKFGRKYLNDVVILSILGVAALLFFISVDAFERLHDFSRNHEDWELDELFTGFMVASIGLAILLLRRTRALRKEVDRRRQAERLAQALARQDSLTGLPNRRSFEEESDRRLARARRQSDSFALFFIDFDRFKQINDNLGHEAGDRLLQEVAERLKKSLRAGDFLGRLGGDEFAVLVEGDISSETVGNVANRLLSAVGEPVTLLGRTVATSASIGVALYPRDGRNREALLKKADAAMYQAKEEGRRRFVIYDPEAPYAHRDHQMLEFELKEAIAKGEIVPFYQLIRGCENGEIGTVEVLARWRHPKLGLLNAGDFVPLADAAGLIQEMFDALLDQVCRDVRTWPVEPGIAVNVTPHQLSDGDFAQKVFAILSRHRFPPARLEIEITEDALVVDLEATRRCIRKLKDKGVRVVLDDFGTGYSSLRQLRELPFDRVKIDRSFVAGVGSDRQSEEIVISTINLCRALGLKTVAEGIEDQVQADWICAHGADAAQGFFYARPVSAVEVLEKLKGLNPRS